MLYKKIISTGILSFLLVWTWAGNDSLLAERFRDHVRVLASDSLEGRGLGTQGAERAREYIVQQFREAGIQALEGEHVHSFRFRYNFAWLDGHNIVGWIEGSDPVLKDEFILIGAHYDHLGYAAIEDGEPQRIFPGADDNASGVAAIIEAGRYFAQNPQKLGRSLLIVAFDAEESGLIGSRQFVNNSPVELEKIKMMFSLDMVGMYEANNGLHLRGIGSLEEGQELAWKYAIPLEVRLRNTGTNIPRRTDTAPFGDMIIPAAHVYTGTKSPYHEPEDTYEKLDYEGMVLIHHYMTTLLAALSVEDELRAAPSLLAQAGSQVTRRLKKGILFNLGAGHHRYPDEFFDAKSRLGLSAGFFLQLPLGNLLSLQAETLYDYNASKIEGGNFYRHSLTFPLNLQLGTPRRAAIPLRAYMFGGGYFRHSFAGDNAGERIDFQQVYRKDEWGYTMGLAMEVFGFTIGYTHRKALTSLLQSEGPKILDTNGYFTMGYRF